MLEVEMVKKKIPLKKNLDLENFGLDLENF